MVNEQDSEIFRDNVKQVILEMVEGNQSDDAYVKQTLGNPIPLSFSNENYRTRRNLIILAIIAMMHHYLQANFDGFSIWKITSDKFNENFIDIILVIFLTYNIVYFFWQSFNTYKAWNLKMLIKLNDMKDKIINVTMADAQKKYKSYNAKDALTWIITNYKKRPFTTYSSHELHNFQKYHFGQFWYWVILEAGLPLALALWALILLIPAFWGG